MTMVIKNLNSSSKNELRRQVRKKLCELYFAEFIKDAWGVIEPHNKLNWNWHIDLLAEELQHLSTRYTGIEEIQKALNITLEKYDDYLCINMPPRELKTIIVTVLFPCWLWIRRPDLKVASVSYEQGLSIEINLKRRDIIKSAWYQKNWGFKFVLRGDQDNKGLFQNTEHGLMEAISVRGSFTGKGYDLIIFDDLQDPLQADSVTMRKLVIDFLKKKAPSRLNNPKTGAFINVQQRLHIKDASGHMKENLASIYKFIEIKMEATENITLTLPITKRVIEIKKGDYLNEARRGKREIDVLRLQMTEREYQAQYNQNPMASAYQIVKDKHIHKYFDEYDTRNLIIYSSWDLNVKKNEKENDDLDMTAGVFAFEDEGKLIIFDWYEDQLGFLEQLAIVRYYDNLYDPHANVVEDKANGTALMESLNADQVNGLTPYNPKLSKSKRLELATIKMNSKDVYFVKSKKMDDLIYKLQKYPDLDHDDVIDAFSQLVNWFFHGDSSSDVNIRRL